MPLFVDGVEITEVFVDGVEQEDVWVDGVQVFLAGYIGTYSIARTAGTGDNSGFVDGDAGDMQPRSYKGLFDFTGAVTANPFFLYAINFDGSVQIPGVNTIRMTLDSTNVWDLTWDANWGYRNNDQSLRDYVNGRVGSQVSIKIIEL